MRNCVGSDDARTRTNDRTLRRRQKRILHKEVDMEILRITKEDIRDGAYINGAVDSAGHVELDPSCSAQIIDIDADICGSCADDLRGDDDET